MIQGPTTVFLTDNEKKRVESIAGILIDDNDAEYVPDYIDAVMDCYQTCDPEKAYQILQQEEHSDPKREHDYQDGYTKMTIGDKRVVRLSMISVLHASLNDWGFRYNYAQNL
jgi:hypothetical protein